MDRIDLQDVKGKYQEAREQERRNLANFLGKELGKDEEVKGKLRVKTSPNSGKGRVKYTSGKRIKEYNLSNWKWVEITDDSDFECIVSLNMPDVDPRSGNSHVLFDRVGLLVSYRKNDLYYETAVYTDIDLPLNEEEKKKIAQLVLEQYKIYCNKQKEG